MPEHGIGSGKLESLKLEMGDGSMNLMQRIKLAIDPHLILNPGKVLELDSLLVKKNTEFSCCHRTTAKN